MDPVAGSLLFAFFFLPILFVVERAFDESEGQRKAVDYSKSNGERHDCIEDGVDKSRANLPCWINPIPHQHRPSVISAHPSSCSVCLHVDLSMSGAAEEWRPCDADEGQQGRCSPGEADPRRRADEGCGVGPTENGSCLRVQGEQRSGKDQRQGQQQRLPLP
eukprot:CAMPEP_0115111154 /NCGR_PEP_ID=MMETSP0227-20121206/39846_2 /TAXON_ID=89957 /ORGANISM="Polarella glacialis, Strain CCMP 1383" /LENGTH=161 /DNA_ID=CAMNT_0002510417 /DNA_START=193 /DNA_END=678 /DNA_ORIENTATION=-